jgi:hypothetical protein
MYFPRDDQKQSKEVLRMKVNVWGRVARWYIFKPKIPIWVNFLEGLGMEKFVIFFGHLAI